MELQKPKATINLDRINLKKEAFVRLNRWTSQANAALQGGRISRTAVLDWYISSHPESLSDKEITDLKSLHFNEEKFARWALNEVKKARARGEKMSLLEILNKIKQQPVD